MSTMSDDTIRVVEWFRQHPGATVNEAKFALWLHVTARMSDARDHGVVFDKVETRVNKRRVVRFTVQEPQPVDRGVQEALSL